MKRNEVKMDMERSVMRRVIWRLVPLMMVCYFAAYLDRVNVSFAALQMNNALGIGAAAYGFGAGLFFVSYVLCEIPSNLVLHRIGARRWIARIMLTWGLCAAAMAFIVGPKSFYLVRLLLGAAEAGFQPGMLFFMTLWFPAAYRARIVGYFMAAVPISGVIGAPLSGLLLSLDGFGLMGWQWLYIIEALPAILLSGVVYFCLTDTPDEAKWLTPDERNWLSERIRSEQPRITSEKYSTVGKTLTSPIILCLAAVFFANVSMNNANVFFLPQIVKAYGLSNVQTGFVSAVPSFVGLAIIWWSRHSDRTGERAWHAALAMMAGAAGLIIAATTNQPIISLAALALAMAGTFSFTAPFWALVGSFLTGKQAAGGIAAISAMGAAGGFFAPIIMGYLKQVTGGYGAGQITIACLALVAALALLALKRWHSDLAMAR
jgi:MFS family permease